MQNDKPKSKIKKIKAREILDSRGNPTVEVELETDFGVSSASVPSGVSKGKYEVIELRDGGKRYGGMGVMRAVKNVNEVIAPNLIGKDLIKQKEIDNLLIELDATENKSHLGANAILAVSIAVCRAGARAKNLSLYEYISQLAENTSPLLLPKPCILLIEGGLHAGNNLDVQEFMILPKGDSFREKLRMGTEIYHDLGEILKREYGKRAINVGYEGGFAPPLSITEKALNLIMKAIEKAGYHGKVKIILDVAASTFYQSKTSNGSYMRSIQGSAERSKAGSYKFERVSFTGEGLLNFYLDLVEKYPIWAIEDPFAQEDWEGFKEISKKLGEVIIIGDDLLVTNIEKIKKAIKEKACNGLVLKPNQIGTVSETIEAAKLAMGADWEVFVKHRGGETNDSFISDLAVGLGAKYIMAGAPARGERVAKYNRLLRIEEKLYNN